MIDIKKQFGEHIRSTRLEKQLTQTELSKLSGVSQNAISAIESGLKEPALSTALKLCGALNIDINIFVKSYF